MKSKCPDKLLTAFLLDELLPHHEHLAECSQCQAEVASFKTIVESYAVNEMAPSTELINITVNKIQEALSQPQSKRPSFFAWPRWSWVPVAVALLFTIIYLPRLNKPVYQEEQLMTRLLNLENDIEALLNPEQVTFFFFEEETNKIELDELDREINEFALEPDTI